MKLTTSRSRLLSLVALLAGFATTVASPAVAATGPPAEAVNALRQASTEPVTVQIDQGVPRFVSARVPVDGADAAERAYTYLERFGDLYGVKEPRSELRLDEVAASEGGEHVRLTQQRAGIPVDGADVIVHLDGADVVATNGTYLEDVPEAMASIGPKSAAAQAAKALDMTSIESAKHELRYFDADLFMTPEEREASGVDGETHLTWVVDLHGDGPDGRPLSWRSFVDAATGRVLFSHDLVKHHAAAKDISISTANGAGLGANCTFPGSMQWFDENGVLPNVTPDAEGLNARTFVNQVYDYFYNTFHRHSFDGADGQIVIFLDTNETNNAFWRPTCRHASFGNNMATLDVVAHELTHGVTASEAALGFTNQPGALNESYSDVFAAMIDTANWTVGEGSAAGTLRSLSDPPAFSTTLALAGMLQTFAHPDRMGQFVTLPATGAGDAGGVHINNGITNKAAFLIAAGGTHNGRVITGIGRWKTARLYYEVLTNWLTSTASFADTRNNTTRVAQDWSRTATNNFSVRDACNVINAFAAVELGAADDDCDAVPDDVDNCRGAYNPDQADSDFDGTPDACEPVRLNWDNDRDGVPNDNDPDDDNDGVLDATDNCQFVENASQLDLDDDGIGTACDSDETLKRDEIAKIDLRVRDEYFERFQKIELPLAECLERTCVPGGLMIEIRAEIALPVRIVDRQGNVLAEAEPGFEQRLVLPGDAIEGYDPEHPEPRYFLEFLRTPDLGPERGYRMTISVHGEDRLP